MNILLTSVGRRSYIVSYFKEALNKSGLLYAANSELTYAMTIADTYTLTPLIYSNDYIPFLLEYCKKHRISAIISLFDIDLPVLAKNRDLFTRNGIKIILASYSTTEICNDKWKTYEFLSKLKIKTPITYKTLTNAYKGLEVNEVKFPLVIKPRWGMGSIGIYIVEDLDELTMLYKKTQREIFKTYLQFESNQNPDEAILIQEKLQGQEHGLDVVNDLESNYITVFAKKKIRMRGGETDIGETVSNLKFLELAKKISIELKHEAILSIDCFVVDQEVYVTELNCRISGHYPLSHLAGVNIPKQIIKWLNGQKTDPELLKFREGLTIVKDLVPKILIM